MSWKRTPNVCVCRTARITTFDAISRWGLVDRAYFMFRLTQSDQLGLSLLHLLILEMSPDAMLHPPCIVK